MEKEHEIYKDNSCESSKLVILLHELAQSLLVIQSYVNGCNERLKENNLHNSDLCEAFVIINSHINLMSSKIHSIELSE